MVSHYVVELDFVLCEWQIGQEEVENFPHIYLEIGAFMCGKGLGVPLQTYNVLGNRGDE